MDSFVVFDILLFSVI